MSLLSHESAKLPMNGFGDTEIKTEMKRKICLLLTVDMDAVDDGRTQENSFLLSFSFSRRMDSVFVRQFSILSRTHIHPISCCWYCFLVNTISPSRTIHLSLLVIYVSFTQSLSLPACLSVSDDHSLSSTFSFRAFIVLSSVYTGQSYSVHVSSSSSFRIVSQCV